jgi:hypothetical protein
MGMLIIISLLLLAAPLLIVVRVIRIWDMNIRKYRYNPFENDVFKPFDV